MTTEHPGRKGIQSEDSNSLAASPSSIISKNAAAPGVKPAASTTTSNATAAQQYKAASMLNSTRNQLAQPIVASFCAGGVAGAVSRTLVSPLERLKILMQVQSVGRTDYRMSIGKALGKMWREEGWKGLFCGNGTNCIRIVPYSAVQYGSYSFYRKFIEPYPGGDLSPLQRLFCGALAGITSVTVTYPMDIVRTRLSIQSASFSELGGSAAAKQTPGMWETTKLMYRTEGGFLSLYRGILPTVAGVAPYVGLNFMAYELIRTKLTPEGEANPSPYRKLLAGALSGGIAQSCTYPFDVLRRRFQINTMPGLGLKYASVWDAVRSIAKQEGLRGFYKGIWPNLVKVAPSMASNWLAYEIARDFLQSLATDDDVDRALI